MKRILLTIAISALFLSCAQTSNSGKKKSDKGYDYWAKYHSRADNR